MNSFFQAQPIFHHPMMIFTLILFFISLCLMGWRKKKQLKAAYKEEEIPTSKLTDDGTHAAHLESGVVLSDPYVIEIKNSSAMSGTATIFGFNRHYDKYNFGSGPGIKITNLQSGDEGYHSVLCQSMTNPFKIGKIRIHSKDSGCTLKEFQERIISIHHGDADGKHYSSVMFFKQYCKKENEMSPGVFMFDANKVITVDAKAYLAMILKPGETMVMTIWPSEIISDKSLLNGGQFLRTEVKSPRI